MKTKHNIKMV